MGRVDQLGATAQTAATAIARSPERLQAIVEDFEARAAALEPYLGVARRRGRAAGRRARSLGEAVPSVDELRAELEDYTAVLATRGACSVEPPRRRPGDHAGGSCRVLNAFDGQVWRGMPMSPPSGQVGTSGSGLAELAKFAPPDARCWMPRRLATVSPCGYPRQHSAARTPWPPARSTRADSTRRSL